MGRPTEDRLHRGNQAVLSDERVPRLCPVPHGLGRQLADRQQRGRSAVLGSRDRRDLGLHAQSRDREGGHKEPCARPARRHRSRSLAIRNERRGEGMSLLWLLVLLLVVFAVVGGIGVNSWLLLILV